MNILEMNEKIYQHLKQQGKVAVNSYGSCVYRSPDGSKCAVGCLITDEAYDPKMEMDGVSDSDVVQEVLRNSGIEINKDTISFLGCWQGFHDGYLDDVSGKEYQETLEKFYESMKQNWSNK